MGARLEGQRNHQRQLPTWCISMLVLNSCRGSLQVAFKLPAALPRTWKLRKQTAAALMPEAGLLPREEVRRIGGHDTEVLHLDPTSGDPLCALTDPPAHKVPASSCKQTSRHLLKGL